MTSSPRAWISAYLVALLWPVAFIAVSHEARNLSFATAFADGIGFVALNALVLQVVVPSRGRAFTAARVRDRIGYERWRLLHIMLGVVVLAGAFVHVILVARFATTAPLRWGTVTMVSLAAVSIFYLRIARPFGRAWLSYRLEAVVAETSTASTLHLAPDGHDGMHFEPGQFAWLKLADRRYSLREHPFSIASSAARPEQLRFTIRAAGDFTGAIPNLVAGTRILVDGPHGSYAPPAGAPLTFIVGGVGITPALSFLATAADRGHDAPLQVIYGCRTLDDVICANELTELAAAPGNDVVLVPSEAPDGWTGPSGFVTEQLLRDLIDGDPNARSYFLCGPPPMLAGVQRALAALGVSPGRVHAESF
jgi:predicted ferric reductase